MTDMAAIFAAIFAATMAVLLIVAALLWHACRAARHNLRRHTAGRATIARGLRPPPSSGKAAYRAKVVQQVHALWPAAPEQTTEQLLSRAARCRQMARKFGSPDICRALNALSTELETEARCLDRRRTRG